MTIYKSLENIARRYIGKPLAIAGLAGILSYGNSYAQEFRVNPGTGGYLTDPRIAMDSEGNFAIIYRGIYGQRFDRDGNRIGNEFKAGEGIYSSIAMNEEGNFIVTWWYGNIFAQRFDKEGNKIGNKFQVNNNSEYLQESPVVAMNDEGRFAICWKEVIFDEDPRNGFYAQVFDKDGNRVGDYFLVSQYLGGLGNPAGIAMRDDGDFVITWDSHPDPSIWMYDNFAKRYDRNGNELGERIVVNTLSRDNPGYPNIAMNNDGNYVIVWSGRGKVDKDGGVIAQRFNKDGAKIGENFEVNSFIEGGQGQPSIAMNNSGNFVVASTIWDQDGGGIYAQRVDNNGNRVGEGFQVNSITEHSQHQPQPAMNDEGNFVITWTSENIRKNTADIYAQIFHFSDVFFRRGDANNDGSVNLADAVFILDFLFKGGSAPQCGDAADVNDDGTVSISDPIYLLSFLFQGGDPIPEPVAIGNDPTEDALTCEVV